MMAGEYYTNSFHYFENTGTSTAPTFATPIANPFSLTATPGYLSTLSFADLDGDGDFDMISSDYYGNFYYYENTGTSSAPVFSTAQTNPFNLTDVGYFGTPEFVDLDGDGDFDMISGELYGGFVYFQNTGTVNAPAFATAQTNPFGLATVGNIPTPTFIDLDEDGDLDLLAGNQAGDFQYYENTGTSTAPAFATVQINPFSLTNLGNNGLASPTFADLDGDCDFDLLSGEYNGNFIYFENTSPSLQEIVLKGNSIEIVDGDTIPSSTDSTDFGDICVNTDETINYTIVNTGTDTLTIDPTVVVSGTNAADFSIVNQPAATVLAGTVLLLPFNSLLLHLA